MNYVAIILIVPFVLAYDLMSKILVQIDLTLMSVLMLANVN